MNYYQVLGVPENASDKEIKKAYKKLVKQYHPDIFHGDKEFAENKIKEINEAYDTLSVPDLKEEYDNALHGVEEASSTMAYTSQAQANYNVSRVKDNDFYNSDSYRHYSTRYYNRSRTSAEFEEYKRSQKKSEDFFSGTKTKLILTIGLSAIVLIIVLIVLLSSLKNMTVNSVLNDVSGSNNGNNDILYIEKGLSYDTVITHLGEPTNIKYNNSGFRAYYYSSYIEFNNNNIVVDWLNKGDFYSFVQSGSQEELYTQLYNQIQNAMYFENY